MSDFTSAVSKFRQPGSVGVIPTDTVYGLAAKATDEAAVKRLYSLKVREKKPGTLIASSIDQLVSLGLKRRYLKAVEEYWPAPLSVIIPTGPELAYLHQGTFGLAVRLPADKDLAKLLSEVGPLLTTSANSPGMAPAGTTAEAKYYFGESVDFYIDGGDLSNHQASTVIRVVDDMVEVIRPGAYKISDQS